MALEVDEVSGDEDGGSELSDVEDAFVGDEAELPNNACYDVRLSNEEVELHNLTHLPYRSWRPHCVRDNVKRRHHRKKKGSYRAAESLYYQLITCG